MNSNPLAEVFGFPISNQSKKADNFRANKLCPYCNIVPNCTKDKAQDPLGVCSIFHNGGILDFASVEVQGVYISGNLRNAFNKYIENPAPDFRWDGENYPHPDYLSSSRKRLIPQMLSKGGIFKSWGKKQCIVIQEEFFSTLPKLPAVNEDNADIAWFLYRLEHDPHTDSYHIALSRVVYTEYHSALNMVIAPRPGSINVFVRTLQKKLESKNQSQISPENPHTILDTSNGEANE